MSKVISPHDLSMLTPHQQLALVTEITGRKFHLRPFDELLSIKFSPHQIGVKIARYRYRELTREYRLDARKIVLTVMSEDARGLLLDVDTIEVEDERFAPTIVPKFSRKTPGELADKFQWEIMCASPGDGSARGERDSFQRQSAGYDYEPGVKITYRTYV